MFTGHLDECYLLLVYGSFRKLGVPYLGCL